MPAYRVPTFCIPQTHRHARIMARDFHTICDAKGWRDQLNPQARQAAADTVLPGPRKPPGSRWLSTLLTEVQDRASLTLGWISVTRLLLE